MNILGTRQVRLVRIPLAGGQVVELHRQLDPDGTPGPLVVARGFRDELDAAIPGGSAVAIPVAALDAFREALDTLAEQDVPL